jgi:curli biogenesis system outer membrane secretion channel CsgG
MKFFVGATLIAFSAVASAGQKDGTTVSEKDYDLPTCSAPVAKVLIGQFTCKSAACQASESSGNGMADLMRMAQQAQDGISTQSFPGIGDGMGAMLTTALQQTGCFEIQDRDSIEQMRQEMELAGMEFKPEPADFMIAGAITSLSMSTKRKAFGGGAIPIVGAISSKKQFAELGVDVRILDPHKAKVVDATTFVGNNQTSSTGFGGAAWGGGGALVGGMSNVKGTPMEDVVRDVLVRVAAHTSAQIVAIKSPQTVEIPAANIVEPAAESVSSEAARAEQSAAPEATPADTL